MCLCSYLVFSKPCFREKVQRGNPHNPALLHGHEVAEYIQGRLIDATVRNSEALVKAIRTEKEEFPQVSVNR
jgi:hypothetical protein